MFVLGMKKIGSKYFGKFSNQRVLSRQDKILAKVTLVKLKLFIKFQALIIKRFQNKTLILSGIWT